MRYKIIMITIIASFVAVMLAVNSYAQNPLNKPADKQAILSNLSSMPLAFTENQGQWGEKTLYKANASGATFYFCKDEVAYFFVRDTDELIEGGMVKHVGSDGSGLGHDFQNDKPRYKKESMLIHARFIGANPNPQIITEDRLSHNCNYFYGNDPAKWRTDYPNYSSIVYKGIWPGIDLRYHGNGRGMKYDFIVNPGADISQIRVRYEGIEGLSVAPNGDLLAQTKFGPVSENIPLVYQESGRRKIELTGRYVLMGHDTFGFEVDGYNQSKTLVIDPELLYSTYLGGNNHEIGLGIAVDGSGNAYVTGYTRSSDFPIANPYDSSFSGELDVFVSKFSPTGDSLIYSTYLGGYSGWGSDQGNGIAVDDSGNAYVTGYTRCSDFPTINAYDAILDGEIDVFVTKLSPAGNSLIYSTYLGGSYVEYGFSIVVDTSGSAYVTGYTGSPDFPTANPYNNSLDGAYDAFVSKFSPAGNSLIYSTYIGGSESEESYCIAIDSSGNASVTGVTWSSNFPTVNPYDNSLGGSADVFVSELSHAGNSLIYSTYLGGNDNESGSGIAIDGSGNSYVTGWTSSSNFPTVEFYDGILNGTSDAFVSKFSPAGDSLIYSTYLGGSNAEGGSRRIAVDDSGNAYVTGYTHSSDFPMVDPYDSSLGGTSDAFVTKFSHAGNSLIYSTYHGGSALDNGKCIAVDDSGNVYVTGYTTSSNFPTVNPYDDNYNGGEDAFVSKIVPECANYYHGPTHSLQVSNLSSTSATVSWFSDSLTNGCVQYGFTSDFGYKDCESSLEENLHYIELSGLLAETEYYYKIYSCYPPEQRDIKDDFYTFTTSKVGVGIPYIIYGWVYTPDSLTAIEGSIVSAVVKSYDGRVSYPITTLTLSGGIWYLNLGNLKDTTTNDAYSYSAGDLIYITAQDTVGIQATKVKTVSGGSPQDCGNIYLYNTIPAISNVVNIPESPYGDEECEISATILDTLSTTMINSANLFYYGTGPGIVSMSNIADSFYATIPGQPSRTTVLYYISAKDNLGDSTVSDTFSYYVQPDTCLTCQATIISQRVPDINGDIFFDLQVNNCGFVSYNIGCEMYPTIGDCASGTQYDFDIIRLLVSDLAPGDSFTGYYSYHIDDVSGSGLDHCALNFNVGPTINNWYATCCDEFYFTRSWGRSTGSRSNFFEGDWYERGDDFLPLPSTTALNQNYPNPFNPTTTIEYQLSEPSHVLLEIYNILGSKVGTLIDRNLEAGYHSIEWDASVYSSGIYFYSLRAGNFNQIKKMMLLK